MMNVLINKGSSEVESASLTNLGRNELATIWFALNTQKAAYEKSLMEVLDEDDLEELHFLYTELGRVTTLMYLIRDDHASDKEFIKWLDI